MRIGSGHNFLFLKIYFFLIHLQAVAGGKKCSVDSCNKFYWLPPYEENTDYQKRAVMCSAEGFIQLFNESVHA